MRPMLTVALISAVMMASASALPTAALADPIRWSMEGWKTAFEKTSIDLARVRSGGPPRDGIPSIDAPLFATTDAVDDLSARDPVVTVVINDDARAYPLRVLTWHEIVNDVVGGEPVAITYCPLCNSAPVFERTVDGAVLEFGTTGKLKDSNLIMYDRTTESWWQQFTGEAIVGDMTGEKLKLVPARLESFGQFRDNHPGGKVLVPTNEKFRDYGRNPYVGYDLSGAPFLYDGQLPDDINPMERVVIVPDAGGGEPAVVTMNRVAEDGTFNLKGLTFDWTAGRASALDQGVIAKGRDIGTVIVTQGDTLVPYDVTFAFVARAFHPDVEIVR